jgi:hypothetical protein
VPIQAHELMRIHYTPGLPKASLVEAWPRVIGALVPTARIMVADVPLERKRT